MSNCETFHLNAISVERTYLGDILRAVFHTILFNRALGLVVPREVESALLDLTWVRANVISLAPKWANGSGHRWIMTIR